ncbi:type IV pilus modification protein PilV [Pseudomonas sp. NPDC089406]|uniref:type IV pilus modification protein PilV n=1 Tax=Pseudomonas sp. NPDC089406 TaxID=3364463 RepID=UPI0038511974
MQAKQGGMALLEVLVAMTVLGLGLVTAAALQMRGVQGFDSARREGQAVQLAQGMLEQVRAAGRFSANDEARWRGQVVSALGASASLRISPAGNTLQLELHWPDAREARQLRLQGKVLP